MRYIGNPWIVLLCLLVIGATPASAQTEDAALNAALRKVSILTCVEPPYQIQEAGQPLSGVSVELVQQMLKEAGVEAKIQVLAWARAYRMAQTNENTMLFSILRNPPREKLFKWVGTLHPFQVYFYRLKERTEVSVKSLDDARKYRIGVVPLDSRNIYLRSQGFDYNLDETQFDSMNIVKLMARRIDLLPSDPIVLAHWFKTLNKESGDRKTYDPELVEKGYHLEGADGENYIAMSPQTDDRVVEHFRQALARVKASPRYQQTLDKYMR